MVLRDNMGEDDFRWLARTLEISLYSTLDKLIGRNSIFLVGLLDFGIREMLVLLSSAIDILRLSTSSTMVVTLEPIKLQYL